MESVKQEKARNYRSGYITKRIRSKHVTKERWRTSENMSRENKTKNTSTNWGAMTNAPNENDDAPQTQSRQKGCWLLGGRNWSQPSSGKNVFHLRRGLEVTDVVVFLSWIRLNEKWRMYKTKLREGFKLAERIRSRDRVQTKGGEGGI